MERVPLTVNGAEKLKEELEHLKRVVRREITAAIAEARAHGDLSENAEYHAAKEHQGVVEARIRDLEHKLSRAQIIDVTKITHQNTVIFGATVELVNLDDNNGVSYHIVGEDEADFKHGKISVGSPIARALIGKEEGDVVSVLTPSGAIDYEILSIRYI